MTQTTASTAAVIPLRPDMVPMASVCADHPPKVLTPHLVERLRALNDALRWLRSNGHAPVAVHLQHRLPTIQVNARAALLLIGEAHGCNAHRIDAEHRQCNVILKGCSICWVERVQTPSPN